MKETEMTQSIEQFLETWKAAERAGDTDAIGSLLTDDFLAVGPLGFVLPKPAWLARHRQGLAYQSFDLDEIAARTHGDATLITARHAARGSYQGNPIPEAVRITLVLVNETGAWQIAAAHMSFIAGTPGAPPIPGASRAPR
jgi:ketosteroid isomerase-like protein